jgi:hypothetical protein
VEKTATRIEAVGKRLRTDGDIVNAVRRLTRLLFEARSVMDEITGSDWRDRAAREDLIDDLEDQCFGLAHPDWVVVKHLEHPERWLVLEFDGIKYRTTKSLYQFYLQKVARSLGDAEEEGSADRKERLLEEADKYKMRAAIVWGCIQTRDKGESED